jgi:hypothetical protein
MDEAPQQVQVFDFFDNRNGHDFPSYDISERCFELVNIAYDLRTTKAEIDLMLAARPLIGVK